MPKGKTSRPANRKERAGYSAGAIVRAYAGKIRREKLAEREKGAREDEKQAAQMQGSQAINSIYESQLRAIAQRATQKRRKFNRAIAAQRGEYP